MSASPAANGARSAAGRARRRRRASRARAARSTRRRRRLARRPPRRGRRAGRRSSRGCSGAPCTRCMTWAIRTSANMSSSSARPMSSSPSATLTPPPTSWRIGATPAASRRFDEQLCTTVAPRAREELDVGVAQPDAVGERAAVAEHSGIGEPLELAPTGEGIAPGSLQAALERVQVDARAELVRGRDPTASHELVARPLRRHDRELRAQQRVAAELADQARAPCRGTRRWACARRRGGAPGPGARRAATR